MPGNMPPKLPLPSEERNGHLVKTLGEKLGNFPFTKGPTVFKIAPNKPSLRYFLHSTQMDPLPPAADGLDMAADLSYMQLLTAVQLGYPSQIPRGEDSVEVLQTTVEDNYCAQEPERDHYVFDQKEQVLAKTDSQESEVESIGGDESDYGVPEEESEDDGNGSYMFPFEDTYVDEDFEDDEDSECPPPAAMDIEEARDAEEENAENIDFELYNMLPIGGFKKRRRHRKGDELPTGRETTRMGAIEIAMRRSSLKKSNQIFLPVLGTVFDSADEAYEFYNLYSWEKGFGISYGKSDKNHVNEYKTMQELQCACQGFDKRCIHQSQRRGCGAVVRLLRTEDHAWYISKFVEDHNHTLSVSCGEKMQWGSHRRIDDSAKKMIKYLRDNNVPLGKVHSIMGSMYGSVRDLPFTKRSLRTLCQQLAREQMDNDVKKTLAIFRNMRTDDPDFAYCVDVDKHNRIKTLIWTNHRSKMQYQCFGDVVTFDTTYCTNIYKMPFGLFVGVNNHFQSVVYAGVLMRSEKIKSFTWVFNEFRLMMGGKAPITILTDQCLAMMAALKVSMPATTHLWCKWHVLRKAQESLGPVYSKNSAFRQEFHKVLNEMLTIDEFENAWKFLVTKYKLTKNPFMVRIYECRAKWAKPYSNDKFCARMMSTQRSESANNMLKHYVRANSTMNNFVEKYNDMIFDRAVEEDREQHKTNVVKRTAQRMWPVQKHASKIYTRASFRLFTTELEKSYHFVVQQVADGTLYSVNHAYSDLRDPWVRVSFKVTASKEGGIFECECRLFNHFGILCCHAIRVMNYLGVATIPDRYILKRWTKDARDVLPENLRFLQKDSRALKSHTFRDNLLYRTAMKAVKTANRNVDTFTEMMKHFGNGIKAVENIVAAIGDPTPVEADAEYESSDNEWRRTRPASYQSEPELGSKGKKIYSQCSRGSVRSKLDIDNLKAPFIVKTPSGRKRIKRFLSPVETITKSKKKATKLKGNSSSSFKQTSFCGFCRLSGHKRNNCPKNTDPDKNKRKTPCCTTCKLPGHKSTHCHTIEPSVDDFDFSDL